MIDTPEVCSIALQLLVNWQSLPIAERDYEAGILAIAAENYLQGDTYMVATYSAWAALALHCNGSPLPICFSPRGEA